MSVLMLIGSVVFAYAAGTLIGEGIISKRPSLAIQGAVVFVVWLAIISA